MTFINASLKFWVPAVFLAIKGEGRRSQCRECLVVTEKGWHVAFFSSLCRDIVRSVHLIGWHPLIFEKLSETEQLWMEGGQHSISALVLLGQFLICLERSKAIAACFYHSNSVW